MKLLRALFVVALVLAVAVPVYAETQNVKISGGIDAYWFYRHNYDLNKDNNNTSSNGEGHDGPGLTRSHGDDYFQSLAQVLRILVVQHARPPVRDGF